MLRIELPWPRRCLTPNGRAHWAVVHNARALMRQAAYYAAKVQLGGQTPAWPERLRLRYTFHPPVERYRDDDNYIAALKSARDGLALALGIDDKHFDLQSVVWGEVRKGGCVIMEIEP